MSVSDLYPFLAAPAAAFLLRLLLGGWSGRWGAWLTAGTSGLAVAAPFVVVASYRELLQFQGIEPEDMLLVVALILALWGILTRPSWPLAPMLIARVLLAGLAAHLALPDWDPEVWEDFPFDRERWSIVFGVVVGLGWTLALPVAVDAPASTPASAVASAESDSGSEAESPSDSTPASGVGPRRLETGRLLALGVNALVGVLVLERSANARLAELGVTLAGSLFGAALAAALRPGGASPSGAGSGVGTRGRIEGHSAVGVAFPLLALLLLLGYLNSYLPIPWFAYGLAALALPLLRLRAVPPLRRALGRRGARILGLSGFAAALAAAAFFAIRGASDDSDSDMDMVEEDDPPAYPSSAVGEPGDPPPLVVGAGGPGSGVGSPDIDAPPRSG